MNGWIDGYVDRYTSGWADGKMDIWMDVSLNERKYSYLYEWMDERKIVGWMDGQKDE